MHVTEIKEIVCEMHYIMLHGISSCVNSGQMFEHIEITKNNYDSSNSYFNNFFVIRRQCCNCYANGERLFFN